MYKIYCIIIRHIMFHKIITRHTMFHRINKTYDHRKLWSLFWKPLPLMQSLYPDLVERSCIEQPIQTSNWEWRCKPISVLLILCNDRMQCYDTEQILKQVQQLQSEHSAPFNHKWKFQMIPPSGICQQSWRRKKI